MMDIGSIEIEYTFGNSVALSGSLSSSGDL